MVCFFKKYNTVFLNSYIFFLLKALTYVVSSALFNDFVSALFYITYCGV